MNIVEFIEARIAEDEAWAQARIASDTWHKSVTMPPRFGEPEPRPALPDDPARVLRQCTSLREWLDYVRPHGGWCFGHPGPWMPHGDYGPGYCALPDEGHQLRFLAAIWSDHPDYQQEWATP